MDALIASAGPLQSNKKGKSSNHHHRTPHPTAHNTVARGEGKKAIDPSTQSILGSTRIPHSFHQSNLATGSSSAPLKPESSVGRIGDKKLRAKVARQDVGNKRAKIDRDEVNEWLNKAVGGESGGIEVDEDLGEKTWRVKQDEIVKEVGMNVRGKKFDLKMEDMGSYKVDYTRNGRHLAIASSRGHIATFDWQAGRLHSEIHLKETVRDIKFLHSEAFFAVAQKKYVFIYDQNGVELHKLKQHIDPIHMEFLPYHYLLATVGNAGHLKYHDTSTGVMLTQIPTHLGSPASMAQNPHSAIIHLGHANGTMTLWSPNMTTPHVKLLAHRGPVNGIAVDPSEQSAGRYVATSGMDGTVKLWDARNWGKEVRQWKVRNQVTDLAFSGQGMLSVGGKSGVSVFQDLHKDTYKPPSPYLTLPLPSLTASSVKFCPFDDLLCVGHERGISSLIVPGSGEANFDSGEADLYETRTRRREREVRGVLEKIRPELITLDTEFLGKISEGRGGETHEEREGRSFRQLGRLERLRVSGKADEVDAEGAPEDEEEGGDANAGERAVREKKEKRKMKGKGSATKKYMRKKAKKNIVDNSLLQMKAKVAAQRSAEDTRKKIERGEIVKETGALARFG
ncbi:U3 small nucleolar RNA-associated protein 7 [Cryptococcus wingfieldii CBS 7118]|uniref:U three protein 7 n=1 Tax=Cryptococcus wingfieldii CBS 7118 TaxID=1295528 RepID=A0A1E3JTP7_9TREE|nr:U3 small nucleolar RNA-associated protein 7 [Cryptococcus wingfieldii CBS 7118]ODO03497.1 U3 small nucleolar RNA-associated protein 7 [Cryptococcus wingfieldii CBS 7118]